MNCHTLIGLIDQEIFALNKNGNSTAEWPLQEWRSKWSNTGGGCYAIELGPAPLNSIWGESTAMWSDEYSHFILVTHLDDVYAADDFHNDFATTYPENPDSFLIGVYSEEDPGGEPVELQDQVDSVPELLRVLKELAVKYSKIAGCECGERVDDLTKWGQTCRKCYGVGAGMETSPEWEKFIDASYEAGDDVDKFNELNTSIYSTAHLPDRCGRCDRPLFNTNKYAHGTC